MKKLTIILLGVLFLLSSGKSIAQTASVNPSDQVYPPTIPESTSATTEAPSNLTQFKLTGFSTLEFEAADGKSGFKEMAFNPIFLWRKSDKLFFEAELEVEVGSGGLGESETGLALEFAVLNYKLNKYVSFYAGKFLTPIGTFRERYHPTWINKSFNRPIGFGSKVNGLKRLQSGSELGVGIKGGIPLNSAKMNYSLFLSNGAVLDTTSGNLRYKNFDDVNNSKAVGGRVGLLPFSNSSLEIGVSGYYAKVGERDTRFKDVSVFTFALDWNYVRLISGFGKVDVKGQYQRLKVDDAVYFNGENRMEFNNKTSAYYFQFAYQLPTLSSAPAFLNKLELVTRFAKMNASSGAPFGADQKRYTVGLNYLVSWDTVIKAGFDIIDEGSDTHTEFGLIFSMGF